MYSVYLLLGPEKGLKEDFINQLKLSIGPCQISKFYAFDDYEEELYAQLNNQDLFADYKLVILDEAQEIKTKEKTTAIVDFIKNPSENVTLLIISDELYIHPDIMSAVPNQKDQILKFFELFENKKAEWIANFFHRNSINIDANAANAIIEKVENNIQEFENVCNQLVIYYKTLNSKTSITEEDVDEFLTHTRQETEFSLFSYIAKGKLETSLECLQTLLHTNDSASLSAVVASRLSNYFRRAYSLHKCLSQGLSLDEAYKKKYFDSDRPITMVKDKEVYKEAIKRYSMRDIERILVLLSQYDIKVKEEGTLLNQTVLEKCIYDIICHKAKVPSRLQFASLSL